MKKILFYAGLLATVTSCTQDELMNDSFAEQSKGISFSAVVPDALETRGELSYDASTLKFPFKWYAEQDKINIYANGEVVAGELNTAKNGIVEAWETLPAKAASYKATKSKANGDFTASSDADLIVFGTDGGDAGTTVDGTFVATYGATLTKVTAGANGLTEIKMTATKGNNNLNTAVFNVADVAPMYSHTVKSQDKKYHSVGETVGLQFYRPLAVAGFTTSGVSAEYKELFGNLTEVSIEMLGSDMGTKDNTSDDVKSNIAYAAGAAITVDLTAPFDASKTNVAATAPKVTGMFNEKFGDNDVVYLPLANVNRKAFRDKNVKEAYKVTYKFENIEFVVTEGLETENDWVSNENSILPVPALDMDNYPYLMVKDGASNYALIVNSGNFADIYKEGSTTLIEWPAVPAGINVANVTTIISKVDLTDAEQANLQKFTGLVHLTLDAETKIVKDAFKGMTALKDLNMPLVTEIASDFATNATFTLDTLKLGSYAFNNATINDKLIKSNIKVLDISAVTDMKPQYNVDAKLSFQGLTQLEKIKVNNLKLNSNAFNGCTALELVEGVVDITDAASAFYGCTSLTEVSISGTVIPAHAFNGCTALEYVLYNDAQVAPTAVGQYAFNGCAKLETMNLANATTIGKYGFAASGLKYSSYTSATVYSDDMVVGVAVVEPAIFAETKLVRVHFKNATVINNSILRGVSTLKQIKFGKEFTAVERTAEWNSETFGQNTAQIEFFVASANQDYQEGTMIKLPYMDGEVEKYSEFNFKTITVE